MIVGEGHRPRRRLAGRDARGRPRLAALARDGRTSRCGPRRWTVLLGYLLRGALTIGIASAAAAVSASAASAAIVALTITVGTWALEYIAAARGGAIEALAEYTPSAPHCACSSRASCAVDGAGSRSLGRRRPRARGDLASTKDARSMRRARLHGASLLGHGVAALPALPRCRCVQAATSAKTGGIPSLAPTSARWRRSRRR